MASQKRSHEDTDNGASRTKARTDGNLTPSMFFPSAQDSLDPGSVTRDELVSVARLVFDDPLVKASTDLNRDAFDKFVNRCPELYVDTNPYHCWAHAVHVLLNTLYAIRNYVIKVLPDLTQAEIVTMLVAAICHDVLHSGKSNGQLEAEQAEIAVRYNGVSALEQFSLATVFELWKKEPELDVTKSLSDEERKRFRKDMIDMILSTDIFDEDRKTLVNSKLAALQSEGLDKTNLAHRLTVMRMALKWADVGCVYSQFPVYLSWVFRLYREMKASGSAMDANGFFAMQNGFYASYGLPLLDKLQSIAEASGSEEAKDFVARMREQAMANLKQWTSTGLEACRKELEDCDGGHGCLSGKAAH